jgi:hypothetical protein
MLLAATPLRVYREIQKRKRKPPVSASATPHFYIRRSFAGGNGENAARNLIACEQRLLAKGAFAVRSSPVVRELCGALLRGSSAIPAHATRAG